MTQLDRAKPMRARAKGPSRLEYAVYFAVIFLFALPISLVRCLASLVWPNPHKPRVDFVRCAWREAQIVTPHIFAV